MSGTQSSKPKSNRWDAPRALSPSGCVLLKKAGSPGLTGVLLCHLSAMLGEADLAAGGKGRRVGGREGETKIERGTRRWQLLWETSWAVSWCCAGGQGCLGGETRTRLALSGGHRVWAVDFCRAAAPLPGSKFDETRGAKCGGGWWDAPGAGGRARCPRGTGTVFLLAAAAVHLQLVLAATHYAATRRRLSAPHLGRGRSAVANLDLLDGTQYCRGASAVRLHSAVFNFLVCYQPG